MKRILLISVISIVILLSACTAPTAQSKQDFINSLVESNEEYEANKEEIDALWNKHQIFEDMQNPNGKTFGKMLDIVIGTVGHDMMFFVIPVKDTIANKAYKVILYEHGKFRDTYESISWSQAQINVGESAIAHFALSREEFDAYFMHDVSKIFSIRVIE